MNSPDRDAITPIVAILTYRDNKKMFRGNRNNFADLLRTASAEGVTAYIVAQDDLRLDSRTINGYTYREDKKKWVRGEFPFPNVVYNRIPYRKFEQLPEVQRLIHDIQRHADIRFFNPSFFSKWSLFQWLHGSRSTRRHIPETEKLNGDAVLSRMLRKHRIVYLKPVKGKAGKGIMKIKKLQTRKGSAEYRLTYYQRGADTESARYPNISRLYEAVSNHTDGKEYIAQQGINLASIGGRPFDLRALVQKNAKGRWQISGVGARVAGASSITTHVPRGGSIDDPSKLLSGVFGASAGRRILKDAKKTALVLASQIETGSGHNLGEMSMDLGVDTSGKLWFFEANSKPMKFDEPQIRKTSLRRLVSYWKYLVQQQAFRAGASSLRLPNGHSRTRSKGKGRKGLWHQ
jgi:hypothetical protein